MNIIAKSCLILVYHYESYSMVIWSLVGNKVFKFKPIWIQGILILIIFPWWIPNYTRVNLKVSQSGCSIQFWKNDIIALILLKEHIAIVHIFFSMASSLSDCIFNNVSFCMEKLVKFVDCYYDCLYNVC